VKSLIKAGAALLSTAGLAGVQGCASQEVGFGHEFAALEALEEFHIDYECRIGPDHGLVVAKSEVAPGADKKDAAEAPRAKPEHAVVYSARFVQMGAELAREVFGPWSVRAVGVHAARAAKVLAKLQEHPGVNILMAPEVTCLDGQRASLSLINQKSYVKDFEIKVAREAFLGDPVVDVVNDGLVLELLPNVTDSGDSVRTTVSFELASLEGMPAVTMKLPSGQPTTIQTPVILRQKLETEFEWHNGGTVVLSGLFSNDRDHLLAVFLTARIVDADQVPPPGIDGGPRKRIFDETEVER